MEPNTFPALRRECSCGCEYITIIIHKPGFVDAEPKCPCCGGEDVPKVVCDHADKSVRACRDCEHSDPHCENGSTCAEDTCGSRDITVRCIPVTDGKDKS